MYKSTKELYLYCKYKKTLELEKYIVTVNNDIKRHLSCFRISSQKIKIETGRYNGVTRVNRICKFCTSGMIETAF